MTKKRTEDQHALILSTTAVNGAYEHPTPKADWACADIDPDLFFPTDAAGLAAAVAICDDCSVRDLCLALATARAESGVWGGVLLAEGEAQVGVKRRGRPPKVAVA